MIYRDINNINDDDVNAMYSDLTKLIITAADESVPNLPNIGYITKQQQTNKNLKQSG